MSNVIRFEIKTDAPYSDEEKRTLFGDLVATVTDFDDDVVKGSESMEIVDEVDADAENEAIRAKAIEIIAGGGFRVSVAIDDADGVEIAGDAFKTEI